METYLSRFKKLASEIETHPSLELIGFSYNPAATAENIAAAERAIAKKLSSPVKTFYQETNGLQLSWKFKPLSGKSWEEVVKKLPGLTVKESYKTKPFGVINILSLDKCFINPESFFETSAEGDFSVEYNHKIYPGNSFGQHLRPVDLYSDDSCISFVFEDNEPEKLMQLSDNYIVWDYSRVTDFENYLSMLFITRGIIDSRDLIFREYRGDLLPPLVVDKAFVEKFTPPLFKA